MLKLGADGQTAALINQLLGFTLPPAQIDSGFQALNNDLANNAQTSAGSWCNANAVWVDKSITLSQAYADQITNSYGAAVQTADFKSDAKGANEAINQWAQTHTNGRISELAPTLDSLTRLVLVNAVYFKNEWQTPFNKSETKDAYFALLNSQSIQVPMMALGEATTLAYAKNDQYQMFALPYKGNKLAMMILMPADGQFDTVEANLSGSQFTKAVSSLKSKYVFIEMPRFQVHYDLPLKTALQKLGITDAFDPNRANFTPIQSGKSAQPLFLSDALHKAFINADEAGTEAAASSELGMRVGAMAASPVFITIDHPFIFAICDEQTGTILFLGRVVNPLQ